MARSSQTDLTPALLTLEAQLRECYGRVVYSHKTHEKCADLAQGRLGTVKLWQIGLSAVTTAGFIGVIFGQNQIGSVIGVLASTALLALNTYAKNDDLGEIAQKHRHAAADLWLIREEYLSLITDLRVGDCPIPELQARRDTILKALHEVYSGAPSTNSTAYNKAQNALQKLEDMTFSDAEIDAFLPASLARTPLNKSPDPNQ